MSRALSLLLLLMTPAATDAQTMARVVAESAARSAERNARHPYPLAGTCPYTTTSFAFTGAQTGTGIDETFVVMEPCGFNLAGPDLPLIVMLNGFCLGTTAIFNGITQIPDEANVRGWLVLAITQGGDAYLKKSYGIHKTQANVEFAIDHVIQNYPVDEDRIYGAGWSAGGGAITSYAARHLDPGKPMFAAVATDAGTYELIDTYNNVTSDVQTFMASGLMFEGTPTGAPFGYLRTNTLTYTGAMAYDAELSQLGNLVHTPILHVYSTDDPITYLPAQNVLFASTLASLGGTVTSIPFSGLFEPHSWDLLDPVSTLDFFAQHTVDRAPSSFDVLADRDAVYYWADVTQRVGAAFSPVSCDVDAVENRVDATGLENVAALALSPPATELDPTVDFVLHVVTADSGTTSITVEGVSSAPTYVLDGNSVFESWSFDGPSSSITFDLDGPGGHTLTVRYDDYSAVTSGPSSVGIGANLPLTLTGGVAFKPYVLFLGFSEGVLPISLFDPGDPRNLLVGFATPPAIAQGALDGAAQASVNVAIPNDPGLDGMELRCQFVTLPGGMTIVDEISNRLDVTIVAP